VRVLVTGGSGYVGSAAVPTLRSRGHEVTTIGRRPGFDAAVCDLNDEAAVREAFRAIGDIDAVVHLAARAHDFHGLSLEDLVLANVATTRNVVSALRAEGRIAKLRFVHASSVAVHEMVDASRRRNAVESPYSASKLEAEQVVAAEPFHSLSVLRFAPIYDREHLQDVAKRVFLPGTRVKVLLYPPPMHSLCSLDRAVKAITDAVENQLSPAGVVVNVADPSPFSQHVLAGWFPGPGLPIPAAPLRVLARGCAMLGAKGRGLSRLIHKFASSSVW